MINRKIVHRARALLFGALMLSVSVAYAKQGGPLSLKFIDVTDQVGLGGLQQTSTYSGAAADYDLDGKIDFLISHHGSISLFKNLGGRFEDKTDLIPHEWGDMHGVSFIDINNDNYPDIVVSCGANRGRGHGSNLFFLNESGRKFSFVENPPAIIADFYGRGRSITPDDYNNDGLIDLFIFNRYQKGRPHRIAVAKNKWGGFVDVGSASGISKIHKCGITVLNLNGDSRKYYIPTGLGRNSNIYLQRGNRLEDVTKLLGINQQISNSIVPFDYDNDGDLDLFYTHRQFTFHPLGAVAQGGAVLFSYAGQHVRREWSAALQKGTIMLNILFEGRHRPDLLFLGKNKLHSQETPVEIDSTSLVLSGRPKLVGNSPAGAYVWREGNSLHLLFKGGKLLEACSGKITATGFNFDNVTTSTPDPVPDLVGNTLYENQQGHFVAVEAKGLVGNGLSMVAIPADFNNDGLEDIYQVNTGYSFTQTNPANQLFLNRGHNVFEDVAEQVGAAGPDTGNGNSAIAFDYDNDGDLDLLLLNGMTSFPGTPGPIILLENVGENGNSVTVTLRGTVSNKRGWGVMLMADIDGKRHLLQKYGMNGFLSTSDLPLHLGMGDAKYIDQLMVQWPSGKRQIFKHVPAGSRLMVTEE